MSAFFNNYNNNILILYLCKYIFQNIFYYENYRIHLKKRLNSTKYSLKMKQIIRHKDVSKKTIQKMNFLFKKNFTLN